MEHRNVTISLPEDLLREAQHQAVDRGMSLSRYVATILEEYTRRNRAYRDAEKRQRALLATGLPLGTGGYLGWAREDLHER
ncbi:MAG TPA: type II toxin-antitoxin system CcdA family antitoxin [Chloroflexota bacterium]|nr:type II toxin-antitoxin system CcdA family antitoxin [Chloroflexota bacterium]